MPTQPQERHCRAEAVYGVGARRPPRRARDVRGVNHQ